MAALSASVTRILILSGFPPEVKTRDVTAAFSEWENELGGFKVKWIDDTSLYLVFADAGVAKRAYLHTLLYPPPQLHSPTSDTTTLIRPYDGPDAQAVIHAVNNRGSNSSGNLSHRARGSISTSNTHGRKDSTANRGPAAWNGGVPRTNGTGATMTIPEVSSSAFNREPSPTLPSLPSHPTLNSLISSSFPDLSPPSQSQPELVQTPPLPESGTGTPPRIGDPGKRMLGAALGIRHPGIAPRSVGTGSGSGANANTGGADYAIKEVQKAIGGLTIEEP